MFRKKETGNEKTIDTIIGPATIIEGNITHPKSLRIDGKIIGEVHCDGDVFIGKTGYVEPLVNARNLNIDRKSTRLNSSHVAISYAVFCLKKKKTTKHIGR